MNEGKGSKNRKLRLVCKTTEVELMGFDNQWDEAGDVRIGEKGMKDDIQIPYVD